MGAVKICVFILILGLLVGFNEGRGGSRGGGSRTSSSSSSRGSGSSYSRPSPSYSRPSPSPSYSRPSPSPSWNRPSPSPSWNHPSPSPSWSHPSPSPSRPIGWNVPSTHPSPSPSSNGVWQRPSPSPSSTIHKTQSNPVASAPHPPPSSGSRPIGWNPPPSNTGTHSNIHSPSTQTHYPSSHNTPITQTRYPSSQSPSNSGVGSRPIGWNTPGSHPNVHTPSTQTHYPSSQNPSNTGVGSRPIGWNPPSSHPNVHTPNTQTHYPGSNSRPVTTVHYPGSQSTPNKNGWSIPPPPGRPVGPPVHSNNYYNQPHYSQPNYQGPQKVKVVNKYYNSYPGYYQLPQPSYHYPGYYYTPTYYNYGTHDTGSGALGFFLGYGLGRLTTPTYSHYSFYDGYRPRYDHYTVVHYDHNRDLAPRNPVIQPNTIIGCVGDSTSVCPPGTKSLCTSDGALMCVVNAAQTMPCVDNKGVNCIRSTIPCYNSTAEECKNAQNQQNATAVVNIPCLTTAKIYGDLTFVNNTIIVNATNADNSTAPIQPVNGTITNFVPPTSNGTMANNTATNPSGPVNGTLILSGTMTTTPVPVSTMYPITTTPGSTETTTEAVRTKRQAQTLPQNFCVAVVALPAKKATSEGEKVYNTAKSIVSSFILNAWGLRH